MTDMSRYDKKARMLGAINALKHVHDYGEALVKGYEYEERAIKRREQAEMTKAAKATIDRLWEAR